MVWFQVDDNLPEHPKANRAGLEAMGLWLFCGAWSSRYLQEGFVPEWYVLKHPHGRALAKRLVDAGLWHPSERDGDKGWQFHEWEGNGQRTKVQIEHDREAARDRQRRARSRRDSRVTDDVTNPVSHAAPAHTHTQTQTKDELPTGLEPAKSPSVARASQRAQRLNPAWVPDSADHKRMHFTDEQATEQLASFRDYWCSRGRDAARLDWQATWRNWLRNTDRRRTGTNGHKPSTTDQRVTAGLELADMLERKAITP